MYIPKDGDIFLAWLPYEECLQSGVRPVIIAQNAKGNASNHRTHVIPVTSMTHKATYLPTHVLLRSNGQNGLKKDSVALVENTRSIPQSCLIRKLGSLSEDDRKRIGEAFRIQFPMAG